MTIVDSLHSGHAPDWRIDPQSTITERELVELEKKFESEAGKKAFEARFKDSVSSSAATLPAAAPASRTAKDKALYATDSVSKAPASPAMGKVNLYPTSGIHKLTSPQDVILPLPQKTAQSTPNLKTTTASAEGFVNTVRNLWNGFLNVFGWGTPPAGDVTGETPLTGSPKEQVFSKQDLEGMNKAIEQLGLIIDQKVKAMEQSKENNSENSDKEAELIQLKQIRKEMHSLGKLIAAIKNSVSSKELQLKIAAEGTTKNLEAIKILQNKHLENSRNIEAGNKTAEWLAFINYGSMGIGGLTIMVSIGCLIAGASPPSILLLIGGAASLASAGTTVGTIVQENKTGNLKAENESFNHFKLLLQDGFTSLIDEETRSMEQSFSHQKQVIEIGKEQEQMIRYAQQLMN